MGMWLMNASQILRAYYEINLWHFLCQDDPNKESKICILYKDDDSRDFVPSKFVSEMGLQRHILIKKVKRNLLNNIKKIINSKGLVIGELQTHQFY